MKTRDKIAFALYMINSIMSVIFGFRYLFCNTMMPYHQQAIGMKWEELGPGLQLFMNSSIKIIASTFFIVGFTSIILLMIPFKKGERWAKWLIPFISFVFLGFISYASINISLQTHASTPWPVSVTALVSTSVAFLLSGVLFKSNENVTNQ